MAKFKVTKGYKLSNGTQIKLITAKSMSSILCSLFCVGECNSATFSTKQLTCKTYKEDVYSSTIKRERDQDWDILDRNEPAHRDGWTLAFRGQQGANVPLYNVWNETGRHDEDNSSLVGCHRMDSLAGCQQHFRTSILDNWKNISKVKFALYINGSEVRSIVFNGSSTTRESWFSQSSIFNSSWPTLRADPDIKQFKLQGMYANGNKRRFTIGSFGRCTNDTIYLLVLEEGGDSCMTKWSLNFSNYPVFLYAQNDAMVKISRIPPEVHLADVMAVFVQFN